MLRSLAVIAVFFSGVQSFGMAYDTVLFSNELINGFYRHHLAVDVDKKVIGSFGAGTASIKSANVSHSGNKTIFTVRQDRGGLSTDTWTIERDSAGFVKNIIDRKVREKEDGVPRRDILRKISLNEDGSLKSVITQNLSKGPTKVAKLSYSKDLCNQFRNKVASSNAELKECIDIAKSYDDLQAGIKKEIERQGFVAEKQTSNTADFKNIFTKYDEICQIPPYEGAAMLSLAESKGQRARLVSETPRAQPATPKNGSGGSR